MADKTTNLDLISSSQAQKEITSNALSDALSPSSIGGRQATNTNALTWGYYGGRITVGRTSISISNGAIGLTANANNYIELNNVTGAITKNTSAFSGDGYTQLYMVTTDPTKVTDYIDYRTTIKLPLVVNAVLDFPSTASMTSSDLTVTVTGAVLGDIVNIGIPNGSINSNGIFTAWVSATNTVKIRFTNFDTVAVDPASGTFKVAIFKF